MTAAAPTLTFGFHLPVTVEGDDATMEIADKLNAILADVTTKLKFGE